MLRNIDEKKFAEAIVTKYRFQTEKSSISYAKEFCKEIDEKFEPLVKAWIDDEKLPIIKEGKYTIGKIMSIQNTTDFLFALKLLNEYRLDPIKGEDKIWKPRRELHFDTRK